MLFPRFASPDEKLPESDVYFMPCLVGRGYLGTRAWAPYSWHLPPGAARRGRLEVTVYTHVLNIFGFELAAVIFNACGSGLCAAGSSAFTEVAFSTRGSICGNSFDSIVLQFTC